MERGRAHRVVAIIAPAITVACASCASPYVVWRDAEVEITESGGMQRAVRGGRRFGAHAAIGVDAVAESNGHIAYAARDARTWRVFEDDVTDDRTWDAIGAIVLGKNSELAYVAQRGNRFFVVGPATSAAATADSDYDAIVSIGFDDANRLVWAGKRDGTVRVYVAGVASRAWSEIRDLRFAPLAYLATDADGEHLVRGAEASPAFPSILEVTPDANGFVARAEGHRVAFAWEKKIGEGEIHHLVTANGHFAYAHLVTRGARVVHDGRDDAHTFDSIDDISIAPDGLHDAYVGVSGKQSFIVVDGIAIGAFAWACAPVFYGHDDHYAFVASHGAGAFVRAPRGSASFDAVIEDSLVVRDDGRWAIIGGYECVRRSYVVVDGKPHKPFDFGAWLSPSGKHATERLRAWLVAEIDRP